jgi:hypothetical protein
MLEQFLDRIHCYPLAVPIREVKKVFSFASEEYFQKDWIKIYDKEELIGVAILQRKAFYEEEKKTLLRKLEEMPERVGQGEKKQEEDLAGDNEDNNDREALTRRLEEYETNLFHLRKEYYLHQQALRKLADKKLSGPWTREWEMMRRRKRHNMSLAWLKGAKACVLGGGCCGRPCGCCEIPLRTYLEPSTSIFSSSKKKIKHIYGHCNAYYCRCCVRSRGFSQLNLAFTEFVNNHHGRQAESRGLC